MARHVVSSQSRARPGSEAQASTSREADEVGRGDQSSLRPDSGPDVRRVITGYACAVRETGLEGRGGL